jgi:tetratricopeptide (TPR) repeat protein
MRTKSNYFILLIFIFLGQISYAQTDKQKALDKGREAIKLMDNGNFDESIKLLKEAQKLDPDYFNYPYEMAYANYAKGNYKEAAKILEKNKNHKDVTEVLFQLLGNCYDVLGDSEKAFEAYDEGLKKFPNSGEIYLEKGNVYWSKKEYNQAIDFYEKGIEVEPSFPSNYYRATLLYCSSSEEVWGMIYGEIFMNLERKTQRTAEISKLLFDTYKKEITFTSDTSMSVSFSKNATININDLMDTTKALKLPFGMGAYEPTLLVSILNVDSIDINSLSQIRSAFVANYFQFGHNKTYPNILFDYHKKLIDAGHFDAYNHWLLMVGDKDGFDKWHTDNNEKWEKFLDWYSVNGMEVNENNKFFSGQY